MMRIKSFITSILVLLICFVSSPLTADTIYLKEGSPLEGDIIISTTAYVRIFTIQNLIQDVPHNQIDSLLFIHGDHIRMVSGASIACKILRVETPEITAITRSGLRVFPTDSVEATSYFTADQLVVPFLPPTGPEFNNRPFLMPDEPSHKRALLAGLTTGGMWFGHDDWRSHIRDNLNGPTLTLGGNLGISFSNHMLGGVVFEYMQFDLVNTGDAKSEFYAAISAARIELRTNDEAISVISWFAGLDAGVYWTDGNILTEPMLDTEFRESGILARPYAGLSLSTGWNLNFRFGGGYQIANALTINAEPRVTGITLNFSGWFYFLSAEYVLPF